LKWDERKFCEEVGKMEDIGLAVLVGPNLIKHLFIVLLFCDATGVVNDKINKFPHLSLTEVLEGEEEGSA
jgi:hypothetical protein